MWQRVKRPVYPLGYVNFTKAIFSLNFGIGSKRLEVMSESEAKLFLDYRNAWSWLKVGFLKGEKT